jgi:hypothetical protein
MAFNPLNALSPTDNFNRANGNIGADWTHIRELSWDNIPPQIVNQVLVGKAGGVAHYQVARWAGTGTFTDDQYVEFTLAGIAFNGDGFLAGGVVRCSADTDTAADFYGVYILDDAPNGGNHTTVVFKMVNGTSTPIATLTNVAWSNGDKGLLSVVGSTIRLYKNRGTPIGTWTNQTDIPSGGKAGVLVGGNATAAMGIDEVELGNVTSNDPPTFSGPNIDDITVTVNTSIGSTDYSGRFTDAGDTLTFAVVGTLPTGVSLSSAGVLSGTPTQTGTFAGLVIRATDTAAQTVDSDTFTITVNAAGDTTPPTLSSPTSSATGPTTGSGGVTTDEGNGTLYAVVTTSATAPTAAQIRAGQNQAGAAAVYAANQAVSSTGAKTFNATGLSPSTTYYWHFTHRDAASNDSAVASSASFTTTAASTLTSSPMKNNTGTLLANETGITVHVYQVGGGFVVTKTGETTDASGVMTLSDAALSTGTTYRLIYVLASGAEGMEKKVAT